MEVGAFLQRAAQIAVGEDAAHASSFVHDRGHPHAAAGHLDHRLHGRHAVLDARHVIAAAHDLGNVHQRLAGQPAAGMAAREIVRRKAARAEKRDRERVSQREGRGGARRRREIVGAGFLLDRGVE